MNKENALKGQNLRTQLRKKRDRERTSAQEIRD